MRTRSQPFTAKGSAFALAAGFLLTMAACDSDDTPSTEEVVERVEDAADDVGDAAEDVIDEVDDATSP